jgi:hypothetical protein
MSIKINRLEEGHNSYPLVCRRPAETVSLQRRQICYRWGTPAYWSLIPRSSMFYLFEFCLKNMWNCSLTQHILSHNFYDWKLCELFLLRDYYMTFSILALVSARDSHIKPDSEAEGLIWFEGRYQGRYGTFHVIIYLSHILHWFVFKHWLLYCRKDLWTDKVR